MYYFTKYGLPQYPNVRTVLMSQIIDFDPAIHQKVRYQEHLYVVVLSDFDFFNLPPDAQVVIHLISNQNKIVFREEKAIQLLYTVKKRELIIVESHIRE